MEQQSLFNNYKYCESCRRPLPLSFEGTICSSCQEQQLFQKVKEFIRSNDVTEYDVAQEFNIPLQRVKTLDSRRTHWIQRQSSQCDYHALYEMRDTNCIWHLVYKMSEKAGNFRTLYACRRCFGTYALSGRSLKSKSVSFSVGHAFAYANSCFISQPAANTSP